MTLLVKICGLTTPEPRSTQRSKLVPTWWGSCSFHPRRANVRLRSRRASSSKPCPRAAAQKVALSVDASDDASSRKTSSRRFAARIMLQLHGKEQPDRVRHGDINAKFGLPVMKALRDRRAFGPISRRCRLYDKRGGSPDLRRPRPARRDAAGRARCQSFDWRRPGKPQGSALPYMLSGGLDPPVMSPTPCASRVRVASMSPPASKARAGREGSGQ